MTLTKLEKDVIVAIAENEYSDIPGDPVWSFAIEHQTKIAKGKQISGIVSSLVKKGFIVSDTNPGDNNTVYLTKTGIEEYNKIKKEISYKDYIIKPKRDFGQYGFLINGKRVRKGFVVTDKHNINVMPGATWFQTIREAKKGIDVLIKYGEKNFWKGLRVEKKKIEDKKELQAQQKDLTDISIEIKISHDGKIVWINTAEKCILRVCRIQKLLITDMRSKETLDKEGKNE